MAGRFILKDPPTADVNQRGRRGAWGCSTEMFEPKHRQPPMGGREATPRSPRGTRGPRGKRVYPYEDEDLQPPRTMRGLAATATVSTPSSALLQRTPPPALHTSHLEALPRPAPERVQEPPTSRSSRPHPAVSPGRGPATPTPTHNPATTTATTPTSLPLLL